MKSLTHLGLAVVFCVLAAAAVAQEVDVYDRDGVQLSYDGWRVVPSVRGDLEELITLEPDDLGSSSSYRQCHLERGRLAPNSGMTQAILNERLQTTGRQMAEQSPIYASVGRLEHAAVTEVDGISVLDVIVRGAGGPRPAWMADRTFAIVNPDASGDYYRFTCSAMSEPTEAQVSAMRTLLASLRFGGVRQ